MTAKSHDEHRRIKVRTPGNLTRQARSLAALLTIAAGGCAASSPDDATASADLALQAGCESDADDGLSVRVNTGKLHGKLVGDTREFLGIPYAEPPVGALRFAPPVPAGAWSGSREATEFGAVCPQPAGAFAAPGAQSEDCLTLNVYTPKDAKKRTRWRSGVPVMVWIYGGAFVAGGSTSYDAQKLSELGDLVVVTLNYRLGALGFLSHPALDQERPTQDPSGNDAIRDQQLALRWVQDNIGAFGGDPDSVTIFGESAGSMSTCLQMVSPKSRDLGQRFIMESAVCVGGLPISDKPTADALGQAMGDELCAGESDVIGCLRAKPVSELIAWRANDGISGAGWAPLYDAGDPVMPEKPLNMIATGNYNKGPVIVGTNKNEWGLFQLAGLSPNVPTVAAYEAAVSAQFGPLLTPAVLAQYPAATDAEANSVFITLMTDVVFRCPTRVFARLTSAQGSDVHLYSFEEGLAYHAMEIPYVFGNPNPLLAPVLVESLRDAVQSYWTQFANTGDPNVDGQPTWPEYSIAADPHMTLKATSEAGSGLEQAQCDFWDFVATQQP